MTKNILNIYHFSNSFRYKKCSPDIEKKASTPNQNIFNHNINSYNTDVENYCFSSYEVNVYLPEKNIEQEESVGWD